MKQKQTVLIVIGIAFVLLLLFGSRMFFIIKPGEKGIIFRPYTTGLDTKTIFQEGFQLVAPWNKLIIYDARINEQTEDMDVLAKDGLAISLDLSFRYKPIEDKIPILHKEIGTTYLTKIIVPQIRSSVRKVIGKYLPEELYSSKREAIQEEIFNETKGEIEKKYLYLDAVLIRSIKLPDKIITAIERKLDQQQQSQEYKFRIDKERQEAQRKTIEAEGIADYNRIINASLSDKILTQKGIDATLKLAESQNAKVVVVGSGKNGLPIILGNN